MKKRIVVFSVVTLVILVVLTVLNVHEGWQGAGLFPPFIIAAFVILAKVGNAKKKKILSVISLLLGVGALCLCLVGAAVALTFRGCEWINWVNVLWYGYYSFISIRVIICNYFSKENQTKIVKFATAILVGPMVLYFLRFFLWRLWDSYYGVYLLSLLLKWVVEEVLAILTVLSTVKKKNTFSVIALILSGLWLILFRFLNRDVIGLIFTLSIIILNCKSLMNNHTVRVKKEATCPHCGGLLAPGKIFCINCGAKIGAENENRNTEAEGE